MDQQDAPAADSTSDRTSARVDVARRIASVLGVTACVAVYVFVVRLTRRGLEPLGYIERNLPGFLLLGAIVVATVPRITPEWSARVSAPVLRSRLTAPATVAFSICAAITPALLSWLSARWAYSRIGGVLPWSDAKDYHIGGLKLLDKGTLDAFTMRRPINAGFYATRMLVTDGNFWHSMLIQAALAGLAAVLMLRTIAGRLGLAAALTAAAVMYSFIRPLLDLTLSETLGFTVGCVAVAALWHGIVRERPAVTALGLLMLSLSLNIRAGEFFVLPALVAWLFVDNFHERRVTWRPVLQGLGGAAGGFVATFALNGAYGVSGGAPNSNFVYTLYGLAHGGTGWTSYQLEFKGQHFDTEGQLARAVLKAALRQIEHHPWLLEQGLVKGFRSYIDQGLFAFMPAPMATLVVALLVLGLIRLLPRGRDRRLGTMLIAAWLGMLVSVPFIIEDGGYRVLAATIPLMAVLPAAGASLLSTTTWRREPTEDGAMRALVEFGPDPAIVDTNERRFDRLIPRVGIGSAAVLVVAPFLAVAVHSEAAVPAVTCEPGSTAVVADIGEPSPHVTIMGPGEVPRNFGEMTLSEFTNNGKFAGIEIASAFSSIDEASVIIAAYNLLPSKVESLLIVAPRGQLPHTLTRVRFCGQPFEDATAAAYGMMRTYHFEEIG